MQEGTCLEKEKSEDYRITVMKLVNGTKKITLEMIDREMFFLLNWDFSTRTDF